MRNIKTAAFPAASGVRGMEWRHSRPALDRLVRLLRCPICHSLMRSPCALNGCNHHFCRKCIELSISDNQANCPICHLPAWTKDVKSDRHVDTLIHCISEINNLIVQRDQRAKTMVSGISGNLIQRKLKSRSKVHQSHLLFHAWKPLSSVKKSRIRRNNDALPFTSSKLTQRNIRGETPLHIASIKGNRNVVRDLLRQGFNPNVRDNAGWTPLHECCNHGHADVATLLLDHGALINAPGFDGDTPLHDAVANGHFEVASLLISRGANPLVRNSRGIAAGNFATSESMNNLLSSLSPRSPSTIISSDRNFVLLGTGLKSHQKILMEETAKQLGASVANYFSSQGVIRCNHEKHWVDETPYEVLGTIIDDRNLITYAPQKGRENSVLQGPKLFSGYEFYFTGEHQSRPSKQDLEQLIHIAGGIVLAKDPRSCLSHKSTPPYHTCTGSQNVVLVMGNSQMDSENCSTECILQVYPSWIFDCLSEFRLLL